MLLVSGLSAWATHSVVRSQERRLLHGRASEAGLVFTSSLESLTTGLVSLVAVLRLTGLDSAAFQRVTALATPVSPATAIPTVAAVSLQSGVFRVLLVKGPGLTVGQVLTGRRAAALARAGSVEPTSTGVMGAGTSRKLGFALRATDVPAARGELFVYRETDLGAVAAGRRAGIQGVSRGQRGALRIPAGGPRAAAGGHVRSSPAGSRNALRRPAGRS